jgi:cell division protein FtsB
MADDLKQRLRRHGEILAGLMPQTHNRKRANLLMQQAADRIEALEAENATLKAEKAAEVAHADRLAEELRNVAKRCGPMAEDGKRATAALAAHDARRKP